MNRHGFGSGGFGHPPGSAAGRGAEADPHPGRLGFTNDLPGADGLADAWSTGHDRQSRAEGTENRLPLLGGQLLVTDLLG